MMMPNSLHDSQKQREVTGILGNLFLAVFALFGQPFERGDTHAEQLHDDGRVDVRPDAEREERTAGKRAARDAVHKIQKVIVRDRVGKRALSSPRNGNVAADSVNEQNQQGDEDLFSDFFYFKSVF